MTRLSFDGDPRLCMPLGGGSPVSGSLDDSSFIQHMNPVLAHPFKEGFADAMHAVFWLGAAVLVIGLVLLLFLPEVPLRTQSGMAARASDEAREAADAARAAELAPDSGTVEVGQAPAGDGGAGPGGGGQHGG